MLFWIRLALLIFTGVTGWLLIFFLLYPKQHWALAALLASVYTAGVEFAVAANLYGLKRVFSTLWEIAVAYSCLGFLIAVMIINVITKFRQFILDHEVSPVLLHWQTWAIVIVPIVVLCQSIAMALLAPYVRQHRNQLRQRGREAEWKWQGEKKALDSEAVAGAQNMIAEFKGKQLALEALARMRSELHSDLWPAFDAEVETRFGRAGLSAVSGRRSNEMGGLVDSIILGAEERANGVTTWDERDPKDQRR